MCTQNKPTQLFYANTVSFQIIAFLHIYSPIWITLRCTVALQAAVVLEGYIYIPLGEFINCLKGEKEKK